MWKQYAADPGPLPSASSAATWVPSGRAGRIPP